jgi:hypothetical protein
MNLILDVLRDPIWQFIGVVIPVLSAVVIYGYRKLRSRKINQALIQAHQLANR